MFHSTFVLESNAVIPQIIDPSFNHFFIHQFNPNSTIEWFSGTLKTKRGNLENMEFRNMAFDLNTDLEGVKKLLKFNPSAINIYQFNKPFPGSLLLESLKEPSKQNILKQNGLKHIYALGYEFLTISSFDEAFIKTIRNNYSNLLFSENNL